MQGEGLKTGLKGYNTEALVFLDHCGACMER